ncbi:transporter substrate-binding protein [Terrilactibacillus sp. S3-3]|nr:transporter substrate-binding protein [Terrilactibacillus sp. S3-3]
MYYTGALPNQQLQFFIPWMISQLGMSFYLVGSDYIFPRMTNKHMYELLNVNGGRVVGEAYTPLGTQNYEHILLMTLSVLSRTLFFQH